MIIKDMDMIKHCMMIVMMGNVMFAIAKKGMGKPMSERMMRARVFYLFTPMNAP
jgi:tartrate dehydratase beta subunit/fumarate hydratase class I family protein